MNAPEWAYPVRIDTIGAVAHRLAIAAGERERAALAARFDLAAIDRLEADVTLARAGETVTAQGRIRAAAIQSCVATGEPVRAAIDEPFALRFVPAIEAGPEIELGADDLDVMTYTGGAIDLGEAVAQGFALALDPFPRSPAAQARLAAAGVLTEEEAERLRRADSPFAILKGLTGEE